MNKKICAIVLAIGLMVFVLPMSTVFGQSAMNLTITKQENGMYVAVTTGCIAGEQYEFQYKYEGLAMDWGYGGVFIADSNGVVTTFEIDLTNLQTDYPFLFRTQEVATGAVSNTVKVNLSATSGTISEFENNESLWLVIIAAIVVGAMFGMANSKKKTM